MAKRNLKTELKRYYLQKQALTNKINEQGFANSGDTTTMDFYDRSIKKFRNEIKKQLNGEEWLVQFDRDTTNATTITDGIEKSK